jgi:transcriptional regulator GlxA family with amidase domain
MDPAIFLDLFAEKINKHIEDRRRLVASGIAKSFEEYHKLCGQIAGAEQALQIARTVVRPEAGPQPEEPDAERDSIDRIRPIRRARARGD